MAQSAQYVRKAQSRAVLLDAGAGILAAIVPHEMTEVLVSGETLPVPLAPPYCRELSLWNDEWLPVSDLALWSGAPETAGEHFLAVVTYQNQPGEPLLHGCLRLAKFPNIINVSDAQACALPGSPWRDLAVSCFRDEAGPAPILSLAQVFNLPPERRANAVAA